MIAIPARIVVASQNPDKITEVEAILDGLGLSVAVVRGRSWASIDETEDTFAGNALLKARVVCAGTGVAALADDTGLEVEALGGAPGIRTARFAGPGATNIDNMELLLEQLRGEVMREARFCTAAALVTPDGDELVSYGELRGVIATEPRGEGGFGYDPIFDVDGRTLAEIDEIEKNEISHRAQALRRLVAMLHFAKECDISTGSHGPFESFA